MSNKKKLIPALRFPEFKEDGEWDIKTLDMVVNDFIVPMRDKPKKLDGNIPWCRIEDFDGMFLSSSKSNQGVSAATIKEMKLKVYPVNTLLVSCSADLGRCAITQKELVTNQTFIGLVPNLEKVAAVYLYYWMTDSRKELNARSSGTTISYLSRQGFEKFDISLPKLKEQQKIADCLSSLDDLLAAHNEKLKLLKGHKKGLMQNLFPEEGEQVPKFRFPEFENDGEWEEKMLGDLLEQKPEYGINAAAVEFSEELPTYLRITDISEDGHFLNKEKVSVAKAVTEKNYLVEGDVVMARTGASVGKSYKYRKSDGKLVFAGFLIRIKPTCDLLDSEFLFQFFATDVYWKWVKYISARSGQPGINGAEYSSMPIGIPSSINEQQKIASCLSEVDDLIKAETEKIEALKAHKKGLMQGLFPKMEN